MATPARSFGELRRVRSGPGESVREEMRRNLLAKMRAGETLFPGILGYQDTVVPRVVPGFTDAHWFREAGLVAYGFVPRWNQPPEDRGVHGPNERISVENLERGIEILIAILQELDRQELAPPVQDAVPGG